MPRCRGPRHSGAVIDEAQGQGHGEEPQSLEEVIAHGRIPQLQPLGRELALQRVGAESAAGRGEREQHAGERERPGASRVHAKFRETP